MSQPPDSPEPPSFFAALRERFSLAGGNESALLHFLLQNIPDRIYFKDEASRFIRISRAQAAFFGLASALEAVGKTDSDFFTHEHAEAALADEQLVMRTGEPIVGKVEKETLPSGEVRWALTTKMALRDAHGTVVGTCGISKDFTEQMALQEALAQSNAELDERQQQWQQARAEVGEMQDLLKQLRQQLAGVGRPAVGPEARVLLGQMRAGLASLTDDPRIAAHPLHVQALAEMRQATTRLEALLAAATA